MIAKKIVIKGKVQGVWFRMSAKQEAESLGLCGWVKNLPNGNVELEVTGALDRIQALIEWCKSGPELSIVREVMVSECPSKDYDSFSILR